MPDPPIMPRIDLVMSPPVTAALVPAIHVFWASIKDVDARHKTGHDLCGRSCELDRGLAWILAVRELARHFNLVPNLLLGEVEKTRKNDEEDDHLKAEPFARHHVRLGGPHQECGGILSILLHGLR